MTVCTIIEQCTLLGLLNTKQTMVAFDSQLQILQFNLNHYLTVTMILMCMPTSVLQVIADGSTFDVHGAKAGCVSGHVFIRVVSF